LNVKLIALFWFLNKLHQLKMQLWHIDFARL